MRLLASACIPERRVPIVERGGWHLSQVTLDKASPGIATNNKGHRY